MPHSRVEIGDPERDEVPASPEEIFDLRDHPGWHAVQSHLREVVEQRRKRLSKKDIPQREADFLRGYIASLDDVLGNSEEENLLEMLETIAQEQQENGRSRG